MRRLIAVYFFLSVVPCASVTFAEQIDCSIQNTDGTTKKNVREFLTPDGKLDLETVRLSDYQGSLDLRGFNVHVDPVTSEPIFERSTEKFEDSDPDDIYWDNSLSPNFPGVVNSTVRCATVYRGRLIIGGSFSMTGSYQGTRAIAAWDGSTWSSLGSGMGGDYPNVCALAVYDTLLIAGGSFYEAGGVSVNCIAAWNGSTWLPLGSGLGSTVQALAVYNGQLIAGGSFYKGVVAWDGTSWIYIAETGGPAVCDVKALAVYGGNLIAAGMELYGDKSYVWAWDGYSWSKPGSGMTYAYPAAPIIYALIGYDGYLIAGGRFQAAGQVEAHNVAAWDGAAWISLGSGLDSTVFALTVYDDYLFAGGLFETSGGSRASFIAKWGSLQWLQPGSGVNSTVFTLAVYERVLIAGGIPVALGVGFT